MKKWQLDRFNVTYGIYYDNLDENFELFSNTTEIHSSLIQIEMILTDANNRLNWLWSIRIAKKDYILLIFNIIMIILNIICIWY